MAFTQTPETFLGGTLGSLFPIDTVAPGVVDVRTRVLKRCPGAQAPPAADGSNPYIPDPGLCDPADGQPADVNKP